jgi:anti-anti-sigma factor
LDDFKIKIIDDIAIVAVDMLVATHRNAKPLWNELENKSILEWSKVIIDISNCIFIDSTFLGMIVKIHRRVMKNNGQVKLVYPEQNALKYLYTMGIVRMLECFNDLNQAVNSFDTEIPTRKIAFSEEITTELSVKPKKFKLK